MQARKHASRLSKRIAIDFMGREIDENESLSQSHSLQLEELDEAVCNENLNVCPTIEFDRPTVRYKFFTIDDNNYVLLIDLQK